MPIFSSNRRGGRRAFTLIEVLVAVTLLSVGLVATLAAFSLANQWSTSAARLREGVRLAEREMTLATSVNAGGLHPHTESSGPYTCAVAYAERPGGLSMATVTVTWSERSAAHSYVLSQVFRPAGPT